jgi:hypothetical protein
MRLSDWESQLSAYVTAKRDEPFAWGVNDCCLFAAGAVEAVTGDDPMLEFRGHYSNEFGAARALVEIGAGTLEATLDGKFPEIGKALAQRGDLAFHEGAVGVVMGDFAWFVSDDGLTRIARPLWTKCWSVGRG